jgi:hypothetical protein
LAHVLQRPKTPVKYGLVLEDELVLRANLTCVILVSDIEHELPVAYFTDLASLFLGSEEGSLLVKARGTGPVPAELTEVRFLLA